MMIDRERIRKELERASQQRGVGSIEQQQFLLAMTLQVVLDIRDLLQRLQPPAIIATTEVDSDANRTSDSESHR